MSYNRKNDYTQVKTIEELISTKILWFKEINGYYDEKVTPNINSHILIYPLGTWFERNSMLENTSTMTRVTLNTISFFPGNLVRDANPPSFLLQIWDRWESLFQAFKQIMVFRKCRAWLEHRSGRRGKIPIKTPPLLISLISNALKDEYLKGDAICFPQPDIMLEKIKKNLLKASQQISLEDKPCVELGLRPFLSICLLYETIR
jgi:hypothetical protein